jgi:hypothetical protein
LAAPVLWVFRAWLSPYHQPQRGGPGLPFRAGDLTPLFSVWSQVAARAFFERGEFPLWSDHIYGGEPFFAKPQIGVLSLTTLLSAVLPAQVVATWTFLLHLWIAGVTSYLFGLELLRLGSDHDSGQAGEILRARLATAQRLAALTGALSFALSNLLVEQTMQGHGPIVLVACWMPLVWRALLKAFLGPRVLRQSLVAGVLVAVQVLAGGETIVLYTGVGAGLWALGWLGSVERTEWGRALRRVVLAGIVAAATAIGLALIKLLPGFELMAIANRAGGLSLDDASGQVREFAEPALLQWLYGADGVHVRALLLLAWTLSFWGVWTGWRGRATRGVTLGLLGIALAGVLISHSRPAFSLLWHVVPMFRFQRIPQRALVLFYLSWSALIALGAGGLLSRLARTRMTGADEPARGRVWLVGLMLAVAVSIESFMALPAPPPARDIRREIAANRAQRWIAQQAGEFRVHALENRDRNWGIEHVTVPLGLSNLVGWDHLWLLDFLGAEGVVGREVPPFVERSYRAAFPARFWGLLNVRYVTAARPVPVIQAADARTGELLPLERPVPGLRLIRQFEHHPFCQPAHSDGPYVFENEHWMPRAWVVPQAILVLGERSRRRELTYQLIDHPDFDPRRIVVLEHAGAPESLPIDWHGASAVLVGESRARLPAALATRLNQSAAAVWYVGPNRTVATLTEVGEWLRRVQTDVAGPSRLDNTRVVLRTSNRVRIEHEQAGYLVLAEKFAHFPGWSAESASGRLPLLAANGVASTVRVQRSGGPIEFRYRPQSVLVGGCISMVTSLLVAVALLKPVLSQVRRWGRLVRAG